MQPAAQTALATSRATPRSGGGELSRLAERLQAHAPYDGTFDLPVAGVHAVRASRANSEFYHVVYQPALCIVAQGAKRVLLGAEVYQYDPLHMLVCSVDLPVASQVTQASLAEPFLCLKLDLEPSRIAELTLKVYPNGLPPVDEGRGVYLGQASPPILNAAVRLLELMDDPQDAQLLAPLVVDEILIRLLRSPIGGRVAQIGLAESSVHRIARAVSWLRANFDKPMNVEELAEMVHMSVSSFHQHFKKVTSMTPLQFQKALRLQEARRLLLSGHIDVTTASWQVGYASVSQFIREYRRFFGASPRKDVGRLRRQLQV